MQGSAPIWDFIDDAAAVAHLRERTQFWAGREADLPFQTGTYRGRQVSIEMVNDRGIVVLSAERDPDHDTLTSVSAYTLCDGVLQKTEWPEVAWSRKDLVVNVRAWQQSLQRALDDIDSWDRFTA